MPARIGERFTLSLREASGALGDLGTLLPLMLGAIAVAGLAPMPVLLGFGAFYVATAMVYRLPIPVQPMKAVAAVLLTTGISAESLAVSGVLMGLALLALGLTGFITRVARLVPQSVLAGLQFGLGLSLALVSLDLMKSAPAIAVVTLGLLLSLLLAPRLPAVLIALTAAIALAQMLDVPGMMDFGAAAPFALPMTSWPSLTELEEAVSQLVLPQLSLTFTNAAVITALVAGDYFGARAAHVTPARLSVTSGLANLLLTPFGALPMCHGAGGLAAHYRFGARSGTAPLAMGLILIGFAILPGAMGLQALAAIPAAGLGALLLLASAELAISKRLFDCQPSCWPVIAVTAAATLWVDPFWGLVAGSCAELARLAAVRAFRRRAGG